LEDPPGPDGFSSLPRKFPPIKDNRTVNEAGTKDKKHHFLPGENGVFLIIEEN